MESKAYARRNEVIDVLHKLVCPGQVGLGHIHHVKGLEQVIVLGKISIKGLFEIHLFYQRLILRSPAYNHDAGHLGIVLEAARVKYGLQRVDPSHNFKHLGSIDLASHVNPLAAELFNDNRQRCLLELGRVLLGKQIVQLCGREAGCLDFFNQLQGYFSVGTDGHIFIQLGVVEEFYVEVVAGLKIVVAGGLLVNRRGFHRQGGCICTAAAPAQAHQWKGKETTCEQEMFFYHSYLLEIFLRGNYRQFFLVKIF